MISAKNLTKKYKDFTLNISLELPVGRITGLVGKNGAGKSTTIKLILGLICPDEGELRVLGKPADQLSVQEKQQIGTALADSGFSAYLTVTDVAKILSSMYAKFDKDAFLSMCKRYGLPENKIIQKFSTGMKAKLRVLAALSHEARLLVLDEPTAGMDVEARNEILDIIRYYLVDHESSAVLITSHIASDLEGICDDIYLIDGGCILLHEDTDIILSDYAVLKMDQHKYDTLDRQYLLAEEKDTYEWKCLTNQKQYYSENYPGLVVESCGIDDLILMMTGGKRK